MVLPLLGLLLSVADKRPRFRTDLGRPRPKPRAPSIPKQSARNTTPTTSGTIDTLKSRLRILNTDAKPQNILVFISLESSQELPRMALREHHLNDNTQQIK
jgi:hypothetical protein